MFWRLWPHIFLWLAAAVRVAGQSSNVTECVSSYGWSVSPLGQTPCLVAAYLESLCGVPTSVDAIPVGTHYLGPTNSQQDPCKCSSVTYSLVSACGGCQGRTFQNWSTWSQFCVGPEVSVFPKVIPEEVQVPTWAYINVTLTGNTFDALVAQQSLNGNFPTPSAPSSTSTTSSIQSISSTSTSPSAANNSSLASNGNPSSSSHSNAGAIAGGVIGGLVVLAIIVLGLLWYFIRKRRNAVQRDVTFDSRALVSGPGTVMTQTTGNTSRSPPDGPSPVPFSQSLYDTSDSNVFPLSPMTSGGYTSPHLTSRRSLESVSPSMVQLGGYQPQTTSHPNGYRGAAEV